MDDIDHLALIEEWIQYIYAAYYENNLNQDVKIPSIKKKIDRNNKTEYYPTRTKESLNWLPFFDTTELTEDRIENDKKLLL